MKKLFLTLFLAITAIALNAQTVFVSLKFSDIDGTNWGSGYTDHTVIREDFKLVFTSFSKQTGTITDCPVTKNGNLVFSLEHGATFSSVKFTLKQWAAKDKTASLQYSTDGTTFSAFSPAITSSNFEIEANEIPAGTVAIKLDLSADSKNQVGIESIEYTVVGKEETRTPVTLSFGDEAESTITLGDTFTLPELSVDPAAAKSLVTYSSDNEDVATVDAATGAVTVVGTGTAVFTASFAGNDTYAPAAPAKYTLKVEPLLSGNELYIEFAKGTNKDGNALNASAQPSAFISEGVVNVIGFTGTNTQVYGTSTGGLKLASGKNPGSFTLKLTKSYTITGITVSAAAYGSDVATVSVNGESFTPSGSSQQDYQLTYIPTAPTDEISITANKRAYIGALTIYYETGEQGDYVEAPQFSYQEGPVEKGTKVELTSGTEGASIYYTIDGTTPTTESTLYTEPITINETTTVSAIAVKEGMQNSPVSKAEYTVVESYATLADWMKEKPATDAILDATLTAIYQNGQDLWVCENGTYALVYGELNQTYANGNRIPAPVSGQYKDYYGLPEFVPVASTFGAGEKGDAVEAQTVKIADLTIADAARYIRLEGIKISATSNNLNFDATDGENTVVLRQRYSSVTIPVTDNATVYGFVGVYNGAIQIYPILIEEQTPEPTEVAALTITPEFGIVYPGDQIIIDCATEGALLSGFIGETELDGEAMPYTYTVNEAVGTKIEVAVYGHKTGLTHTEELEGEYTVTERPSLVNNNATFNWTDSADFSGEVLSDQADLDNKTYTKNVVAVTFIKGSSSNTPKYYVAGHIRFYQKNEMTVKLNSNVGHLDKIEFTYASGNAPKNNTIEANCGTMSADGKTWTAEASRAEADEIREVTFTNTGSVVRMTGTTVAYTDVPTGIETVEAAQSDAPAVYYNLQGMRVENPACGIFIRVQGNNVEKILVK